MNLFEVVEIFWWKMNKISLGERATLEAERRRTNLAGLRKMILAP